jgi:hypothetical protein
MDLTNSGNCFKCAQPGHWADNCQLKRAASIAEHEERIRQLGDRFAAREITRDEKTAAIKHENELWHGKKKQKTGARN